jgi:hypothetical protein
MYLIYFLFSDHASVILDSGFVSFSHVAHFRFERFWILHDGFSAPLIQWWSQKYLRTNKAVGWQIKIKNM